MHLFVRFPLLFRLLLNAHSITQEHWQGAQERAR